MEMNSVEKIQIEDDDGDHPIEVLMDKSAIIGADANDLVPTISDDRASLVFLVLPVIFLAVTLLGGLRFAAADNAFIFLKPPLICLVFATVLFIQFVRTGLIELRSWFDGSADFLRNLSAAAVLLTVFTATTQIFNSLLPEKGLPLWVVGFCFCWTLWVGLFSTFDAGKLIKSTGAVFAFAFVTKYLVLAELTAPQSDSWTERIFANPAKEAFTWLLDLPRYSAATGYIQFLAVTLFLLGLYLLPARLRSARD